MANDSISNPSHLIKGIYGMTVQFAAARTTNGSPVARALSRRTPGRAANDNGDIAGMQTNDNVIHAALRHFARHGLGAAREARKQAESAFFDGDRQGYDWWLGICRALDKQIAGQLEEGTGVLRSAKRPQFEIAGEAEIA